MYDQEKLALAIECDRLKRINRELVSLVRRDASLFARISKRTKRWIKTQDQLIKAEKDAMDEVAILVKRRKEALAKLTKTELHLLGLHNPDADEDPDD